MDDTVKLIKSFIVFDFNVCGFNEDNGWKPSFEDNDHTGFSWESEELDLEIWVNYSYYEKYCKVYSMIYSLKYGTLLESLPPVIINHYTEITAASTSVKNEIMKYLNDRGYNV